MFFLWTGVLYAQNVLAIFFYHTNKVKLTAWTISMLEDNTHLRNFSREDFSSRRYRRGHWWMDTQFSIQCSGKRRCRLLLPWLAAKTNITWISWSYRHRSSGSWPPSELPARNHFYTIIIELFPFLQKYRAWNKSSVLKGYHIFFIYK